MLLQTALSVIVSFILLVISQNMTSSEQQSNFRNVSMACNGFTVPLYRVISSNSDSNIVTSPLSLHMILSLLSNGAGGYTSKELTSALHHDDTDSLNNEFKALISMLNDIPSIELHIANTAYIQDGFTLLADFSSICRNIFQSSISRVDFKDNIYAADNINLWVQKATNNKISNIISSDDLDEDVKMVLLNAIYFKSKWLHAFNPEFTENREFHVSKTENSFVPTMFKKAKYVYGEISDWHTRFIEISYLNEEVVMIILLPNEVEGLQELENNFNWEILTKASRFKDKEIELYLPKFKFEVTINLKEALYKIGLKTMFEDNANFERLSRDVPLKVSNVIQKVFIEVNEEGSEAAAATAATMRLKRMVDIPEQFMINHPFMFAIEHKSSNALMFLGTVRKLASSQKKDEL